MPRKIPSLEEKLNKIISGASITEQGCLETNISHSSDGYPHIFYNKSVQNVCRLLMQYVGYDLTNKVVMHTCDNTRCIYTAHLVVGTQMDNMRDASAKGRASLQKISRQDAEDIRRLFREGHSMVSIAKQYNVHRIQIRRVLSGERHILR